MTLLHYCIERDLHYRNFCDAHEAHVMDLISNLPETLLIEIFQYCKLLPLCYVSRKFNNLISSSAALMGRLKLVITKGTLSAIEESERIHRNAFIKFDYEIDDRHFQLFTRFQELRSIEFVRCIIQAETFFKILENIPNLKSLYISSTFLKNVETFVNTLIPPRAENLKIISLRNSDELFLKFFKNASSIEFVHLVFQKSCALAAVQDFFETQKNIKVIDRLSIPFIDQCLIYTILNDMSIKKLAIELDRIDIDTIKDMSEIENRSVHHLSLCGSGDINSLLCHFKCLRSLEIEMNSQLIPAQLLEVTRVHSNLISLTILDCSGMEPIDCVIQISLPNLIYFKSGLQFSNEGWTLFSKGNPKIKTLKLQESLTDEEFERICLNFHELEHFELPYDPCSMTSRTLNFICSENFPKHISHVEISIKSGSWGNFILTENHLNHLKNAHILLKLK